MDLLNTITCITVNFKTPELTEECINSFAEFYPEIPHLVVDNGGCLESEARLHEMVDNGLIDLISNSRNRGHGPALNQALAIVNTSYAFLLDSDTKVERYGFLEDMTDMFMVDYNLFAVGWLRWVNATGVAFPDQEMAEGSGLAYIHPYACLLDVNKFRGLAPFAHIGAPAIHLMRDAQARGYTVKGYPVQEYIWHMEAGTRGMFGGDWNIETSQEPGNWNRYGI